MTDIYVVDVQYAGEQLGSQWCAYLDVLGRRSSGESVRIKVRDFPSYFYCLAPREYDPLDDSSNLRNRLNEKFNALLSEVAAEEDAKADTDPKAVGRRMSMHTYRAREMRSVELSVEPVRRTPVLYYQGETNMFRVVCTHPSVIARLRDKIVEGLTVGDTEMPRHAYEANLLYVLRFMVDTEVRAGAWLRLSEDAIEDAEVPTNCSSPMFLASPSHIRPYTDDEEVEKGFVSREVCLSFDIECAAPKGIFPDAEEHPITHIACDLCTLDGRPKDEIEADSSCVVLTWRETDTTNLPPNVTIREFGSESEMLIGFARQVRTTDPDIITSYNGPNFDWKYIVDRVRVLNVNPIALEFSRLSGHKLRNRQETRTTAAYGTTSDNVVTIPGRVIFDMMHIIRIHFKLRSYKLNAVSENFLNERKEDVLAREIKDLWDGDPMTRKRLSVYCAKDAQLPRRLMLHLQMWTTYIEMARVCRVPTAYLLTKGQQIRVHTQLHHKARQRGYAVDYAPEGDESEYEGATVLDPVRGFHTTPVATLDFASLYPSIMQAHNLCYTTHKPRSGDAFDPHTPLPLEPEDTETLPKGDVFVRASKRKGLLPEILDELLGARKVAKRKMAEAASRGDKHTQAVMNRRQLALKVSANSVYGFTGVTRGKLSDKGIARSVTAKGREMIDLTKATVEQTGPKGLLVIYGDTDSVMVMFKCSIPIGPDGKLVDVQAAIAESWKYAKVAVEAVNRVFPKPVCLELEKIYYPYLLISKKRYVGGIFENPNLSEHEYLDSKGIESKRRDNCNMLPRIIDYVVESLMADLSPDRAVAAARDAVAAIIHGPTTVDKILEACATNVETACGAAAMDRTALHAKLTEVYVEGEREGKSVHDLSAKMVPHVREVAPPGHQDDCVEAFHKTLRSMVTMDDHIISKAYSRGVDSYAGPQPHITVIKNLMTRTDDVSSSLHYYLGERVPYIFVAPCPSHPAERTILKEKTEDEAARGQRQGKAIFFLRTDPKTKKRIFGQYETVKRVADRAEDPTYAVANDLHPDALYYVEKQILTPVARILKALVGSKEEAIRRMMQDVLRTSVPKRGVLVNRLSADTKHTLYGTTNGIVGRVKREATPAQAAVAERKKWKQEHGAAPMPRKTGPLDSFFKTD